MFPIPWNFPFRKKNGDLSTISDVINSGGGGGSDLPPHDVGDAGKLLGIDSTGKLEWTDDVSSEIQTLTQEVDMLIDGGVVNKLPNTGATDTKNGVTATYASDGKVTLNASSASTAISDFPISPTGKPFYLKEGTYVLSGGASADARLYIRTVASASAIAIDSGDGAEFTVTSEMASGGFAVYLNVASEKTFDNVVISPMIADAVYTGGYVPYAMTNRELTDEFNSLSVKAVKTFIYSPSTDRTVKNNHYVAAKNIFDRITDGESALALIRFDGGYYDIMCIMRFDATHFYCLDVMQASGFGNILYFYYRGSDTYSDIFNLGT